MRKIVPIVLLIAFLGAGCFDADIAAEVDRFTYEPDDCPATTVSLIEQEGYELIDVTIDEIRDQVRPTHGVETEPVTDTIMECMERA